MWKKKTLAILTAAAMAGSALQPAMAQNYGNGPNNGYNDRYDNNDNGNNNPRRNPGGNPRSPRGVRRKRQLAAV